MSEKIDSGGMARERIPHPCNTDEGLTRHVI